MNTKFTPVQYALLSQLIKLKEKRQSESGYVLVATVATLTILTSLLITIAIISNLTSASTNASETINSGFFAAEAGLNLRANEIRKTFEGFNKPEATTVGEDNSDRTWQDCLDNINSNDGSGDFVCKNDLTINKHPVVSYVTELNDGEPIETTVKSGDYKGLKAQEYQYDVLSVALKKDSSPPQGPPSSILGLRFKNQLIPLFQFAVFFENDADFTIPPNMTLNGRVHSNHDLYLNSAGSSFSLNIKGTVTTAGKLFRGNKSAAGSQQCAGNVNITKENNDLQALGCQSTTSITAYTKNSKTPSSPSTISDWGSKIGFPEKPLEVPEPEDFDPKPGAFYWDKSDLRIALKLNSSSTPTAIEVRNQDNSVNSILTSKLMNSCSVPEATITSVPGAGILTLPVGSSSAFSSTGTDNDAGRSPNESGTTLYDYFVRVGSQIEGNVIRAKTSTSLTMRRPLSGITIGSKVRRAVVSTSNTFFNYREKNKLPVSGDGNTGKEIRMLDVDVEELLKCVHNQSLMGATKGLDDKTEGGLVWFLTVDGPQSSVDFTDSSRADYNSTQETVPQDTNAKVTGVPYGIRLYNGDTLAVSGAPEINGLSIVSDQAIYVRGDFNHARSDYNAVTQTYGSYKKKPAAIMADTINILSNNWELDDSDARRYTSAGVPNNNSKDSSTSPGKRNYTERVAGETTMNVAFLSGSEITGGYNGTGSQLGLDSGGINNYPRFHEHWAATVSARTQECDLDTSRPSQTSVCFNYRGSLVSLSEPRRVNSPFCGSYNPDTCNIYTPPVRNWDYDQDFNDAGKLPPLSPRAVNLVQELFERDFSQVSFAIDSLRENGSSKPFSVPLVANLDAHRPFQL